MKSNQLTLKQKVVKVAEMPQEIVMGVPSLSVTGNTNINIENYGGIIEYTDQIIRIRTKNFQILIKGLNLYIEYYTNDEMKITGNIISIEFKH